MSLPRVLIASLVVLVFGSACINLPEIDSAQGDAGVPTSTADSGGEPDASTPTNLTVNLLTPSEKLFTNGNVDIQVQVTGGTPDKVELLVDDQILTTLAPPYSYQWSTTSIGEGSHRLTVKASLADNTFLSEPCEVVVDRTPPQVVSRSPAPGAQGVWVRQPIEATFSEPLRANPISDSSVRLAFGPDAISRSVSLSNDGHHLTVLPTATLVAPTSPILTLSTEITDLAGNILSIPVDSWTWNHPSWIPWGVGTGATAQGDSNESLATYQLDATGRVIGAWSVTGGTSTKLFIKRWEGGTWKPLGDALGIHPESASINDFTLILDTLGQPIVAWSEPDGSTTTNIHVRRFVNDRWVSLGNEISAYTGQTSAMYPILQLDPSGTPALAWMESDGTSLHICLRRWSKDSWQAMGECLATMNADPYFPLQALRFDSTGRALVAWQSNTSSYRYHVHRLESTGWQDLDSDEEDFAGNYPRLAMQVDTSENPILAWPGFDGTADSIYIIRWNGASWDRLGDIGLNATSGKTNASDVTVQIDVFGNPVIAWVESAGPGPKVHIRRWQDASWQPVDDFTGPESTVYAPGFGLHRDALGNLLLSWFERSSPARLQILRQNR